MVLSSIAAREKAPDPYAGSNADYGAYRKIRDRMSVMEVLAEMDYPADALRLARSFDTSLFDKAGRYDRGQREEFTKLQATYLEKVRKQGGLATAEAMIDAEASGPLAVDLGITLGERPFTAGGLQSLWIELVERAQTQPKQAEGIKALVEKLKTLKEKRPQDDSAAIAHAALADIAGDHEPLRNLIKTWTGETPAEEHRRSRCIASRL